MNTATRGGRPALQASTETALTCLFRLGAQNGTYAEVGAVRRRHLVDRASLTVSELSQLAPEFGFKAEYVRLDWLALRTRPFTHPFLLILGNTNVVTVLGVRRCTGSPNPDLVTCGKECIAGFGHGGGPIAVQSSVNPSQGPPAG